MISINDIRMINDLSKYSDYQLVHNFTSEQLANPFNIVITAVLKETVDLLDLDAVERKIKNIFRILRVENRYNQLFSLSNGQLSVNLKSFKLNGHEFQSLDEVEAALRNPAFL